MQLVSIAVLLYTLFEIQLFLIVFRGYLGPGGIDQLGAFRNCTGGATGYLDRMILGKTHIYQHPTSQLVYSSGPFDPEGLIGMINLFSLNTFNQMCNILYLYWGPARNSNLSSYREEAVQWAKPGDPYHFYP